MPFNSMLCLLPPKRYFLEGSEQPKQLSVFFLNPTTFPPDLGPAGDLWRPQSPAFPHRPLSRVIPEQIRNSAVGQRPPQGNFRTWGVMLKLRAAAEPRTPRGGEGGRKGFYMLFP